MGFWDGKTVVITGGTGSFGNAFTRYLLAERVRAIRIFSRDEFKQTHMAARIRDERMRFLLGDVRDRDRVRRAFEGAHVVVHAAALKQVPAIEFNPLEGVKTNVLGAMNVVEAALDCGIERVLALSTDKACAPVTAYGATKLCAEKVFVGANHYGGRRVRFSVVRYGNVAGSRGSAIPAFIAQRDGGRVTLTDDRMTRFWMTLGEAVRFVAARIPEMEGGEIFVPKLPSVRIVDLINAVAPGCEVERIGIRASEKLHEAMVAPDESPAAEDRGDHFAILPPSAVGRPPLEAWTYDSGSNHAWLSVEQIRELVPQALREAE